MILCANPGAQYHVRKEEIDAAVVRVFAKGWYVLGEQVDGFEKEFAEWVGVAHSVGVGSGTEALHLALAACDIQPGDEVITVAHTAVATVAAIVLSGAKPVFVDIDPVHFTLDPSKLEAALTSRTKVILPVHLYGQPPDMNPILEFASEHGLRVIEDCAQAHGAMDRGRRVGTMGDLACFSFYPTKNLGALGDGGMVVSRDKILADKVRLLREYGWKERYVSHVVGWNSRLDEVQAAVLRVKLPHLDADNARRNSLADLYASHLVKTELVLPKQREHTTHVHHLYVIRVPGRRDRMIEFLKEKDIRPLVHYPVPIHLQPAYRAFGKGEGSLPETERASREVLSLPMYPELSEADVQSVIEAVKASP